MPKRSWMSLASPPYVVSMTRRAESRTSAGSGSVPRAGSSAVARGVTPSLPAELVSMPSKRL
eukprot:13241895-Alexandrium_andersonii.AAC.1